MQNMKKFSVLAVLALVVAGGGYFWWQQERNSLPDTIAAGNGRIEAVDIDVATKISGRVQDVFVKEGDFVTAGQPLAKIDTAVLDAQLREAEAELKRAVIGIDTANSLVTQREAEKAAAVALVAQRKAEMEAARKRMVRSQELVPKGATPVQTLDDDKAAFEGAKAAVSAAEAQVAAAEAAKGYARSQVIAAQSSADAARATIERIKADIDDSTLRSPRDARVQYRVAQPGEVLASGGVVLNLVDLADVYMTFFLPTAQAGRVALGSEARIVLDAAPQYVIPAEITFVADVAQFTPKTVETTEERQKLMFRLKAQLPAELLRKYIRSVKTGLPGMAYVRLGTAADWPAELQTKLPQ